MGINRVRFQKGLSIVEFMGCYGTEEKCHAAAKPRRGRQLESLVGRQLREPRTQPGRQPQLQTRTQPMRALEPQIEALLRSQPPKQRTTPEISRLAPRMRQTQ